MSLMLRDGKLQTWQRLHVQRMYLLHDLTPPEREICDGLLRGLQAKDIAWQRGVSFQTVRNQLTTIHRKVGTHSVLELALTLLGYAAPERQDAAA